MNAQILCTLLSQRLGTDPKKFEVRGQEVVFYDKDEGVNKPAGSPHYSEWDTPENSAIVEDVINNYKALEAAYLVDQANEKTDEEILTRLKEIDLKSIRSMREWMVAQPGAPTFIKDFEIEAADERAELKK
jgi:hypothetical protein